MPRFAAVLAAALVCALPSSPAAHEIPNDVTIQSFLKPEGQRLHLLVRVPLSAMLDIDYPKRGQGLLDLARADAWLRDAATLWMLLRSLGATARLSQHRRVVQHGN